jgi:zinc and cadmium transporter
MFMLERAFHGHAHHTADGSHAGHGCEHDRERASQSSQERASQSSQERASQSSQERASQSSQERASQSSQERASQWSWCGAFAGLALHSLADGAALAASVDADGDHGAGLLAGFATFLAVVLHKPFDSGIIATLMINAGASARARTIVNALYAMVVPLGAVAFLASLRLFGGNQAAVLGAAMAMAAGAFLCIAAADLLPEVEFHSHDRLLLTAALALGLSIAWGITVAERSSHAHEAHARRTHAAHEDGH